MKVSPGEARRVLAISVLFAAVGIFAFVIAFLQPQAQDPRIRSLGDVVSPEDVAAEIERKEKLLNEVSALDRSGASVPLEEKLRMLQLMKEI
jgi:hypothetical protein